MEAFTGKLIHRPSGEDAGVHVQVARRDALDGCCRILWAAEITLPDGTPRAVEQRVTFAPPEYHGLQIGDLARWLLEGELAR